MKQDMTVKQALYQAYTIIASINGMEIPMMKCDDRLVVDLAMDSVELIELIIKLEEFGVVVNESQLSRNLNIGEIAEMILKAQ